MEVHTPIFLGSPGDSDGEESSCNAVDVGSIPELGRLDQEDPLEKEMVNHSKILAWEIP